MAKPQRLPSGRWRIRWVDVYGKRRSETYKTMDAARAALRRRETEIDDVRAGRKDAGSEETFRGTAESLLAERTAAARRASPADRRRIEERIATYRSHLEHHLLPAVGDLRLFEITDDVIGRLIRALAEKPTARPGEKNEDGRTLSASTIRHALVVLRLTMRHGKRPISITLPRELRQEKQRARTRPKYIRTAEEIVRYLDACRPDWFRIASALAIYAGLRRGEVASLRWRHVDFEKGSIRAELSWEGPCKSNEARTVPMPAELADMLRRWRMAGGGAADRQVVLVDGRPMEERNNPCAVLTRAACRRAAVEEVTFHSLRATFASHAANAGLPISQLRALLGHGDIGTTAIYVRTDSEIAAQDTRARLSFQRAAATVITLPAGGHAVDTPWRT